VKVPSAIVALGLALLQRPAVAQQTRAFRVSFAAPPGCPGEDEFSRAIESNSARARRADPGDVAIDVAASATVRLGGFLGVLRIRRPDGTETERTVPATSCVEAIRAMAFIATVAIDPDAKSSAALSDGASGSGVVAALPPDEPLPPTPQTTVVPEPNPDAVAVVDRRPPASPDGSGPRPKPWWLGASASASLVSAIAPGLSPDVGVGVSVGATRTGLVSPLVVLTGHLAESSEFAGTGGSAQFQRLAGRITGCPLAATAGPVLLRPCALFEMGQLRAEGSHVTPAHTARILWLELGTSVRGEVNLVGPLTLGVELGAVFPLVSDTFYFQPSRVRVHQIPAVGFLGALALGVRIL